MATERGSIRAPRSLETSAGSLVWGGAVSSLALGFSYALHLKDRFPFVAANVLVAPPGRVVDLLLQGALGVGEGLGRTSELHAAADVVASGLAVLAGLAGLADLESDAVAGGQVSDAITDSDDGAAGLVAQSERLTDDDVAVAVVVVVVQVGAAEAGG